MTIVTGASVHVLAEGDDRLSALPPLNIQHSRPDTEKLLSSIQTRVDINLPYIHNRN